MCPVHFTQFIAKDLFVEFRVVINCTFKRVVGFTVMRKFNAKDRMVAADGG